MNWLMTWFNFKSVKENKGKSEAQNDSTIQFPKIMKI